MFVEHDNRYTLLLLLEKQLFLWLRIFGVDNSLQAAHFALFLSL